MKIMIPFKNPKTGEVVKVKLGWSWTLFFFAGFWGIPLFLRRLTIWGAFSFGLGIFFSLVNLTSIIENDSLNLFFSKQIIELLIALYFSVWIANHGNAMTAKHYLESGWLVLEPDSDITKTALVRWGVTLP